MRYERQALCLKSFGIARAVSWRRYVSSEGPSLRSAFRDVLEESPDCRRLGEPQLLGLVAGNDDDLEAEGWVRRRRARGPTIPAPSISSSMERVLLTRQKLEQHSSEGVPREGSSRPS
jgi:hypothetical protein